MKLTLDLLNDRRLELLHGGFEMIDDAEAGGVVLCNALPDAGDRWEEAREVLGLSEIEFELASDDRTEAFGCDSVRLVFDDSDSFDLESGVDMVDGSRMALGFRWADEIGEYASHIVGRTPDGEGVCLKASIRRERQQWRGLMRKVAGLTTDTLWKGDDDLHEVARRLCWEVVDVIGPNFVCFASAREARAAFDKLEAQAGDDLFDARVVEALDSSGAFAPRDVSTLEEARVEIRRLAFELLTLHNAAVEGAKREVELCRRVEELERAKADGS